MFIKTTFFRSLSNSSKFAIAPHLSIYNEQEASSSSIMHRITGFFLSVPFLIVFIWENSFTILLTDFIYDLIKLYKSSELYKTVLTTFTSLTKKLFKKAMYLDFTSFQPVPKLTDSFMAFLLFLLFIVAVATIVSLGIAITFHTMHGIQHWAWDDFVTTNSFRVGHGYFIASYYEYILWALWCAPFYIAH